VLSYSTGTTLLLPLHLPMFVTCPAHLVLFDMIPPIIVKEYKLRSSLCKPLQPPVTSSHLGPNILSAPCCQRRSSLNVRGKVSHSYQTEGKSV